MKRDKPITEQVLEPWRNNLGNVGAAMVAAAKAKEAKNGAA